MCIRDRSYTADKYGADYEYPDVPLTVSVSPEVETLLKVYVEAVSYTHLDVYKRQHRG